MFLLFRVNDYPVKIPQHAASQQQCRVGNYTGKAVAMYITLGRRKSEHYLEEITAGLAVFHQILPLKQNSNNI